MPEEMDGGVAMPTIELPSPLRIRQRLGMIATSQPYRDELIPAIEQLGGETMEPRQLIHYLESVTVGYAERHALGMIRLIQNGIPRIIDSLLDDEDQKNEALSAWRKRVKELTEVDDQEARDIHARYTRPRPKVPRKIKKKQRTGTFNIDPKRWGDRYR